jgi:hypothetical protein
MATSKSSGGMAGLMAGRPSKVKQSMQLADTEPVERIHIEVTAAQKEKLKIYSAKTKRTVSQILRQFIDDLPE